MHKLVLEHFVVWGFFCFPITLRNYADCVSLCLLSTPSSLQTSLEPPEAPPCQIQQSSKSQRCHIPTKVSQVLFHQYIYPAVDMIETKHIIAVN